MKHPTSLEALAQAQKIILDAEHALDEALLGLDSAPRAEKVVLSEALERAFDKLRSARAILVDIERRVKPT
jgi:hypothetical protein